MKALLAIAVLACAYGQPALPAQSARRLLQSPSLRDKAWGAWYAGASHDPALREMLVAQLRLAQPLRSSPRDSEGYAYVQALFDALIQIPGAIPNDVILPFEASWRPEILILLAREPSAAGNENALLAMRGRTLSDPEWLVVNDLLFACGSKSFLDRMLQELRITHTFVVADQQVLSCGGSIGCGLSTRRFPKGFPPIALYQLWVSMTQPGDILLFDQPVTAYYRRIVVPTDGEAKWSDCKAYLVDGEPRQGYLAQFLSANKGYELFHPRTTIDWHGRAEEAIGEITKHLDEQTASIEALLAEEQSRGVLKASGMRLTINVKVQDVRRDRSVPLPDVGSREITVP